MTIEFHTQHTGVSDELLDNIRNKLLKLYYLNKEISRAEVELKEEKENKTPENKLCGIRLTVYGDDLLVNSRTESFRQSAEKAIKRLTTLVKQQVAKRNEPPDVITSTVKT